MHPHIGRDLIAPVSLSLIALLCIGGIVAIGVNGKEIPIALVSVLSAAVGSLGTLATAPRAPNGDKRLRKPRNRQPQSAPKPPLQSP